MLKRTNKTPKWAKLDDENEASLKTKKSKQTKVLESDEDEEETAYSALEEMTRSTGSYIGKSKLLPKHNLASTTLRDVTMGHNSNGHVVDLKFHPGSPVLLTATDNGTLSLFQLLEDEHETNLQLKKGDFFLQDVKFDGFKISNMNFFNDANSLLVSASNKNYCFSYDLNEGKVTQIFLPKTFNEFITSRFRLSLDGTFLAVQLNKTDLAVFVLSTMEHLHTFRASDKIADFCFAPFSRQLIYAMECNGIVNTWDLSRKGALQRFMDEGSVRGVCLAFSPNTQFIACGSNTGIINVYEAATAFKNPDLSAADPNDLFTPKPLYSINNLTTKVRFCEFSRDAQLMAFGSSVKPMSGRILHCGSGTVYQNFPQRREMFAKDHLTCSAFSPNNAFFAFGTETGGCKLFRLNYFHKY